MLIERQQTVLLVEHTNFSEMLRYYCIRDGFHNYLLILLDLSIISSHLVYNFYLKWTNILSYFYFSGNVISVLKWELHLYFITVYCYLFDPNKLRCSKDKVALQICSHLRTIISLRVLTREGLQDCESWRRKSPKVIKKHSKKKSVYD